MQAAEARPRAGAAPVFDVEKLEFGFTDADFRGIAARVRDVAGIVLTDAKRQLVYNRVRARLRALDLDSFAAYRAYLEAAEGAEETVRLVNAVTTNLTSFYRENHHFEYLARHVLPAARARQGRIRLWSAGCSSGEEAYTAALVTLATLPAEALGDALILATDIDTDMVARGRAGIYAADDAQPVPAPLLSRHFETLPDGRLQAGPALKRLVRFRQLNLHGAWPMRGPFDAIFCRNVMIYFDRAGQQSLFTRFAAMLRPGGILFIGHAERVTGSAPFDHLGSTIYRKRA